MKKYTLGGIDKSKILKYMGVRTTDEMTDGLVEKCIEECDALSVFAPSVCYCLFDLYIICDNVRFGSLEFESRSLSEHFRGCEKVILFAATVGVGIDRLIEKYSYLSPSKALCFGSVGAQRIEELCDLFCRDMEKEFQNYTHTSRFSPGYGDLDLSLQKDIFNLLDCPKRIGLSLCDSFIMSPSKSVTAMIGLSSKELTE